MQPFISVIIPVYNSEKVIGECLGAAAEQDYPRDKIEVVMPDAGSSDNTLKIARSFKDRLDIKICKNPLKTGEAGKSVGIDNAKGEILAFIDSDNIMPDKNFIKKMVEPFEKEADIMGAEPLYFTDRKQDRPLTRYFALSGVNDPLCLFIGNYDKYSYITGKWTGFKLKTTDRGGYFIVELDEKKIPTIGANGTFLRKECLMKANYRPYMFDIDVVYDMLRAGYGKFVKVKTGIAHIYAPTMKSFKRKQKRRINDFLYFSGEKKRTYPWAKMPLGGVFKFSLYCALFFPLLAQALAGFFRKRTPDWIYHIPVCYTTFFTYAGAFIKAKISGKTKIEDRDNWQRPAG